MTVPDRSAYDASQIDWDRLKRYAVRVARETKLPLDPPVTYKTHVVIDVPVQKRTGGLFGFGMRSRIVNEPRTVTKSTEAVGHHWPLDRRNWHLEDNYKVAGARVQEVVHEQHILALLPNGDLVKLRITETEVFNSGGTRSGLVHHGTEHSLWNAGAGDITVLDFEKRHRESGQHNVGRKSWGDREPGPRVVRHAKGVGINLALKDVLEGRRPGV